MGCQPPRGPRTARRGGSRDVYSSTTQDCSAKRYAGALVWPRFIRCGVSVDCIVTCSVASEVSGSDFVREVKRLVCTCSNVTISGPFEQYATQSCRLHVKPVASV